ncbi:hypothetical protein ACH5RR_015186 [Cinchona calisaya]|uniref:Uncharacterized protein n=1 Tax=Cinchona calisaya TaxID=153742 RepID=A0ABD2ZV37_9GENT
MRSLFVEFENADQKRQNQFSLIKWKLDSKPSGFISLTSTTSTDADNDDNEEEGKVSQLSLHNSLRTFYRYHLMAACIWFEIVEMVVPLLSESLQNIVITDSLKEGKLVFGETHLAQIRNGNGTGSFLDGSERQRIWTALLLKLPLSGRVMKTVMLFLIKDKEIGEDEGDNDDFLIAKDAFDGEDGEVCVEAAMEIMKKQKKYEGICLISSCFSY